MLTNSLLAEGMQTSTIVYISVGAFAGLVFLFGMFKKLTKCSWTGYQIALLFGAGLILQLIPKESLGDDLTYLLVMLGSYVGVAILLFIIAGIARKGWQRREEKGKRSGGFMRFMDHFFGGIGVLLNFATFLGALAGLTFIILGMTPLASEGLADFYWSDGWNAVMPYIGDLIIACTTISAFKNGYALGLTRAVGTVIMIVLTLGALAGSVALAVFVPGVSDLSAWVISLFAGLGDLVAKIVGYAIVSLVFFIVVMILVVLLTKLVGIGLHGVEKVSVFRLIDGGLLALVSFAVSFGLLLVINWAISQGASGAFGELMGMGEAIQNICAGENLQGIFSANFAHIIYAYNPLNLLIGG